MTRKCLTSQGEFCGCKSLPKSLPNRYVSGGNPMANRSSFMPGYVWWAVHNGSAMAITHVAFQKNSNKRMGNI